MAEPVRIRGETGPAAIRIRGEGGRNYVPPEVLLTSAGIPSWAQPAAEMVTKPILDVMGPPSPLSERIFGPGDSALKSATDVGLKLAPLGIGFGVGSLTARGLGLAGEAIAPWVSDVITGVTSGAAGGAATGELKQQPILPSTVSGAILGGAFGAGVAAITPAGRRLAAAYAERARGEVPDINQLDHDLPFMGIDKVEVEARTNAAREAFRRHVPEGGTRENTNPAIWLRALKEAKKAAGGSVKGETADNLELEGDFLNRVLGRTKQLHNATLLDRTLDDVKHQWGFWVTRLATTLNRDKAAFGEEGGKLADMILRAQQLSDHIEGDLVANVWKPMFKGVPKDEIRFGIDDVLHGKGGQLSAQGMAAAKRWREIADDTFEQMSGVGLQEEVSIEHPAADPSGGQWQSVPIQQRTNYVPYYRDRAAIAKLAKRGTPERAAYLQKLIDNGEADNAAEANKILDGILSEDSHATPLYIRGGPMQHERELRYELPRDKNAEVWSRKYIHDYSRRMGQAQVFGPKDEHFKELLENLKGQGADPDRMSRIFRLFVGRPPAEAVELSSAAKFARSASAMAYLGPRVFPLQILQLSNTAGRMGWKRMLEGIAAGWRNPELRNAAEEVGALLPSQHLLTTTEPMEAWGKWWVDNVTQMPRGDAMARSFSAITGGIAARKWAQEYWQLAQADAAAGSPSLARQGLGGSLKYFGFRNRAERMAILQRRLEETLGIPIDFVLKNEGQLPIEATMAAMRNASHNTQFAGTVLDLPEAKNYGWGKFMFILKTFAKQQSTFNQQLVRDAMKGDTGPLIRYLLTYPALYAVVKPYLDIFSSRDLTDETDADALERVKNVLDNAVVTGMFGATGDFINQMRDSDPGKIMGYVAGPAVGFALGTATDIHKALPEELGGQGNLFPIARRAVKTATTPLGWPFARRLLDW